MGQEVSGPALQTRGRTSESDSDGCLDWTQQFREAQDGGWGRVKVEHASQVDRTASTKTSAPSWQTCKSDM